MNEVTDLYDDFYTIIKLLRENFEFGLNYKDKNFIGPRFDEIADELEDKIFLSACGRRLVRLSSKAIDPSKIRQMICITDSNGKLLNGKASEFHSNGFDWAQNEIQNLVVCGDLVARKRSEVRLFIGNSTHH